MPLTQADLLTRTSGGAGLPAAPHVLCVEDDPDIRALMELALATVGGLRVTACGSGSEALALAPQLQPDIVLLDVMMPELDGTETLRRLRADPRTAALPVLFVTAKVQVHEVEAYRQLGAAGVIAKPFDPMTLAAEVRRYLGDG